MTRGARLRAGGSVAWVCGLLLALVLLRLAGMAVLPLMDTTEARYGEIGRKMAELGDWVTPWHDIGVPFWGKPPLSFWLTALSFKAFGVGEFTARLPHLLCALGIAWATWRLGRDQRSRAEGLLAVALLGGSLLFYVSAGAVMTDAALALGTTWAMLGFWQGLHSASSGQASREPVRWLLFCGLAVGLLAKGPLALVLIGAPLVLWTLLRRQSIVVWRTFPWLAGTLLVIAAVAPWYAMAEWRTPGFLRYFLLGEHWHRFLTPGWKGDLYGSAHRFPVGTIWLFAIGAWMPWSLLLPIAAIHWRRSTLAAPLPLPLPLPSDADGAWRLYLLLWALMPLVFFTAARNIIWTYALPALPALALLCAQWLGRWPPASARRLVIAGLLATLVGTVVVGVVAVNAGSAERHSAKALVRAYEARCAAEGPLVYVRVRPHSASFYSRGQALRVDTIEQLPSVLKGRGACVALPDADASLLDALPGWSRVALARAGGQTLWWLSPRRDDDAATDAPPSSQGLSR